MARTKRAARKETTEANQQQAQEIKDYVETRKIKSTEEANRHTYATAGQTSAIAYEGPAAGVENGTAANAARLAGTVDEVAHGAAHLTGSQRSISELISEHNRLVQQFKAKRQQDIGTQQPPSLSIEQIAASGHICVAHSCDLKKITIDQLLWDEANTGKVLVCRTITEPFMQRSLSTLIEDPNGDVMRIAVSNICASNEDTADGQLELRVDNPADVVYLEQSHLLLNNLEWQTAAPVPTVCEPSSWESLQRRGNELFVAGKRELAIVAYTDSIELKRKVVVPLDVADLLANRAAAYLSDEKPMDAFWDCTSVLHLKPGHQKATFRLAKAHANSGRYEEARELLATSPHTTTPPFQAEIVRLNRLICEKQNGDFDLKSLLKEAAASETPYLDHADYNGGVRAEWVSQKRGNGLVAQRDFAPGDLLFVSKAFEATYKSEVTAGIPPLKAGEMPSANIEAEKMCTSRIIRRISKNVDLAKDDSITAVDARRITAIVSFNAVAFSDVQEAAFCLRESHMLKATRFSFSFRGCGVWILASNMNHSCVPNTAIFFVADLMFVRAAKRIRKGEELTASYVAKPNADYYKRRQRLLAESFGFMCDCELCACDLKRAAEQPHLEAEREDFYVQRIGPVMIQCDQDRANYLRPAVAEDLRKFADEFSIRLAHKDDSITAIDARRITAIVCFNAVVFSDLLQVASRPREPIIWEAARSGFSFRGCGVWILASYMNHSCVPNTIIFFVTDLMFVRAAKRIRKGEELTACYLTKPGVDNYKRRQGFLLEGFGFKCECELCVCDLKRAAEQPDLETEREEFMIRLGPVVVPCGQDKANCLLPAVAEDLRKFADEFSTRLAYKDRYDHSFQSVVRTLGTVYRFQLRSLEAANTFEMAYNAAVGAGSNRDDTFSYNSLTKDLMILCFSTAHNCLLCEDFEKAKEFFGKMQAAAKIAFGSADQELLEMLYPNLCFAVLFEDLG